MESGILQVAAGGRFRVSLALHTAVGKVVD